jgi:hypothetical protein
MLRMFKLAKASAIKARTQTINQLKAVLVAADSQLRETLSGLSTLLLIRRCTQLEIDEIHDLEQHITAAVTSHTPTLLTRRGIGPDNAAALLIAAGDNPDRLHSEASFRPVRRQPAGQSAK